MKLFIGLPVYSLVPVHFMQCLLALQARWPAALPRPQIQIAQGDGVARSRNVLAADFLRSDCTHFLQIDCDLVFSLEQILRLIDDNLPVVGGLYAKKQDGPNEWVINTLPGTPGPDARGLQPVRYIGTGFLLVQRAVLEQIRDRFPESRYRADYGPREMEFEFFPMRVYRPNPEDEGRYLSEDWYFCQRWLDMGGEIFADPQVILRHIGPVAFPLRSQEAQMMSLPDSSASVPAAT